MTDATDKKIPTKTPADNSNIPGTTDDATPHVVRQREPRIFKIIVIGDSNVGKTCLTYRFCEGRFPTKVEATIGVDFREKTVEIGNELLKVSGRVLCDVF